jgi:hypothetical protein
VKARLARQAVLTRDNPPLAWFVLDRAGAALAVSPTAWRAFTGTLW